MWWGGAGGGWGREGGWGQSVWAEGNGEWGLERRGVERANSDALCAGEFVREVRPVGYVGGAWSMWGGRR